MSYNEDTDAFYATGNLINTLKSTLDELLSLSWNIYDDYTNMADEDMYFDRFREMSRRIENLLSDIELGRIEK